MVCRVQNDAGLSSYAEILVIVTKSDESSGLTWQIIAALSVIVLIIIAVASLFYYNNAVNRRMSELSEDEEEDESPHLPLCPDAGPDVGEDAAPILPTTRADSQPNLDDEMLDILGAVSLQKPPSLRTPLRTHSSETWSRHQNHNHRKTDDRTVRKQCTDCSKSSRSLSPRV